MLLGSPDQVCFSSGIINSDTTYYIVTGLCDDQITSDANAFVAKLGDEGTLEYDN
jgi:hypothetical protein